LIPPLKPRLLLDFENQEKLANEALNIIKKYGFNRICFVGGPDAPMMYFTKNKTYSIVPQL